MMAKGGSQVLDEKKVKNLVNLISEQVDSRSINKPQRVPKLFQSGSHIKSISQQQRLEKTSYTSFTDREVNLNMRVTSYHSSTAIKNVSTNQGKRVKKSKNVMTQQLNKFLKRQQHPKISNRSKDIKDYQKILDLPLIGSSPDNNFEPRSSSEISVNIVVKKPEIT